MSETGPGEGPAAPPPDPDPAPGLGEASETGVWLRLRSASNFAARRTRILYLAGVTLLVLLLAYRLRAVLNPLLVALLLAYIADPAVRALERAARLPRTAAIICIFLVVFGFVGGVSVYLYGMTTRGVHFVVVRASGGWQRVPPAPAQGEDARPAERSPVYGLGHVVRVTETIGYLDLDLDGIKSQGEPALDFEGERAVLASSSREAGWRRVPGSVERASEYLLTRYRSLDRQTVEEAVARVRENTQALYGGLATIWTWTTKQLFGGIATALVYIGLVPVYAFFLLQGLPHLTRRARQLLPGRHRERVVAISRKIDRACAAFFRGRLMIAVGKGILTWLGLWIVGVDLAGFIGLLAGALSIIPFVGPVAGMILCVPFSYGPTGWLARIIGALVVFAVVEALEAIANPVVLGREVGLHPVTILLALFAFGELFGLFGLLLAVPLGAIAKILIEEFVLPELKHLAAERPDTVPS